MLLYQIQLAILAGKPRKRAQNDLVKKAQELSKYATIPAVVAQQELLDQILRGGYLERTSVMDYEDISLKLRGLIM